VGLGEVQIKANQTAVPGQHPNHPESNSSDRAARGNVKDMALEAIPITLREAKEFVDNFHRHNKSPLSGLFAVAASDGENLVGVAIVGRPVARLFDNGSTAEVTRCCVLDSAPKNTCSFLYARCWQAAKALGWTKLITYTLQDESGSSLRGVGWKCVAELKPNNPKAWQTRPGRQWQPVVGQAKLRWEAA
jgi:hypothetical protein